MSEEEPFDLFDLSEEEIRRRSRERFGTAMLALATGIGFWVVGGLLMWLSGIDSGNPMAWYQVLLVGAGMFAFVVALCSIVVMGWYLQERREEKSIWESENKPD